MKSVNHILNAYDIAQDPHIDDGKSVLDKIVDRWLIPTPDSKMSLPSRTALRELFARTKQPNKDALEAALYASEEASDEN